MDLSDPFIGASQQLLPAINISSCWLNADLGTMGADFSTACAAKYNSIFDFEVDQALSDENVSLSKYR